MRRAARGQPGHPTPYGDDQRPSKHTGHKMGGHSENLGPNDKDTSAAT